MTERKGERMRDLMSILFALQRNCGIKYFVLDHSVHYGPTARCTYKRGERSSFSTPEISPPGITSRERNGPADYLRKREERLLTRYNLFKSRGRTGPAVPRKGGNLRRNSLN